MIFQILDANYVYDGDGFPVVQLFGITPEGKPVTVKVSGFLPYFYARVDEKRLGEAIEGIRAMDLEAEVVERFRPVGYQKKPQRMLKVIAKDPKSVRVYRESVLNVPGVREVYETDVLFKNRYLIDLGLGGMRWAEVEPKAPSPSNPSSRPRPEAVDQSPRPTLPSATSPSTSSASPSTGRCQTPRTRR
jgi:DNA polymerase I